MKDRFHAFVVIGFVVLLNGGETIADDFRGSEIVGVAQGVFIPLAIGHEGRLQGVSRGISDPNSAVVMGYQGRQYGTITFGFSSILPDRCIRPTPMKTWIFLASRSPKNSSRSELERCWPIFHRRDSQQNFNDLRDNLSSLHRKGGLEGKREFPYIALDPRRSDPCRCWEASR